MKNILVLTLVSVILGSTGYAQNHDSDSVAYTPMPIPKQKHITKVEEANATKIIGYFFNVQTGMLVGCNDCGKAKDFTFSISTVQGVTIGRKFRTGVGLGFDSYQNWQTIPLFGMVSWDLIGDKNKNAVFIQFAYGWAHPWFVRDGAYASYTSDPFSGVSGGRMINPQIGYRINYYTLRISMAVGYKFQRIHYTKPSYYYYPNCPMCDFPQQAFDDITQDMNRVQLTMGVGWK